MPDPGELDPAALQIVGATVQPPEDKPYPGNLQIHVDATDTARGIFRVRETIPVQPGPLTLLYPKWIPAHHSPTGPIDKLAGLAITAAGKPLAWRRNQYDVYAFTVDVPAGVAAIEASFEYISPRTHAEGPADMTAAMLDLVWDKMSLYPAGHYTSGITCVPKVTFPAGWQFGSALRQASRAGDTVTFHPVTYNTLVDSPIYAGRYFKRLDLDPDGKVPVHMNIVADAPRYLVHNDAQLQAHRNLVRQAYALFGSHHYDHYDFLVSLSDQMGHRGVEHHQSSEDSTRADYFTDWDHNAAGRDLFAHEFEHSWNGKFRRPADLWTPNFHVPMGDSLLWVYEGQTQYWGYVLTARAGLWTAAQHREALALIAARYHRNRPGFAWRGIAETTNDPTVARRASLAYRNWQMSEEYYNAGQLLWLEVDARLRAASDNHKSLDNFAQAFFGVDDGSFITRTYVFDDVVAALNDVVEADWATFLQQRISANVPPLEGLAGVGWKLVYTTAENEFEKQLEKRSKSREGFMLSLGIAVGKDGTIRDVRWDGPAFKAGVGSGESLVAVNGQAYKPEVLEAAITTAKLGKDAIELLLKYQDRYRTVAVDYHEGVQYPHLVRIEGTPDYLTDIVAAK